MSRQKLNWPEKPNTLNENQMKMGKLIGKWLHRLSLVQTLESLALNFPFFSAPLYHRKCLHNSGSRKTNSPISLRKLDPPKRWGWGWGYVCFHLGWLEEDEEGGRGVPSGQTTPDGPSVLPTDRFLPPRLPWTDRAYYLVIDIYWRTADYQLPCVYQQGNPGHTGCYWWISTTTTTLYRQFYYIPIRFLLTDSVLLNFHEQDYPV